MTNNTEQTTKEKLGGLHRAMPIILLAFAVFLGICFITQSQTGMLGGVISGVVLGLFSVGAYFLPFLIAIHAIFYTSDIKEGKLLTRVILSSVTLLAISALTHAISNWGAESLVFDVVLFYTQGALGVGGGFIGGMIGFIIMSLIGKVGMVIVAVIVFAVYIVYFLSKGPLLARMGRKILLALVSAAAFVEKKFKGIFSAAKASKENKEKERTAERNEQLLDDEFFDVKGGMQTLEIPELGIAEEREPGSIEESFTLRDKVNHESRAEDTEVYERETRKETIIINAEPAGKRHKTVYDDLESYGFSDEDLDREAEDIIVEDTHPTERRESRASDLAASVSDSADSIFTQDFDPYSISESEKLASKPSSRSVLDDTPGAKRPTVIDSIDNLTEDEVERIKRNEAFERRKQELRNASRMSAPTREQPTPKAEPRYEPTQKADSAHYGTPKVEPKREPMRTEARESYSAPSVTQPTRQEPAPKTEYEAQKETVHEKTVEFHIHASEAPKEPLIKEEHNVTITIEKCEPPKDTSTPNYTELAFGADTVYETVYGSPAPKEEAPEAQTATYEAEPKESLSETVSEPIVIFGEDKHDEESVTIFGEDKHDEEPVTIFGEDKHDEEPVIIFGEDKHEQTAEARVVEEMPMVEEAPEIEEVSANEAPEFKDYAVPKSEEGSGLLFEFNGEEVTTPAQPLTVERTKLDGPLAINDGPITLDFDDDDEPEEKKASDEPVTFEFNSSEEDEEEEEDSDKPFTLEFDGEEEDDEWDDEEIPPEKQNPFVHEARGMFDMFKREQPTPELTEDEPAAANEVPEQAAEESEDEYEDADVADAIDDPYVAVNDENEYDTDEDEDEPPFELGRREIPAAEPEVKKAPKKVDYSKYKFPPIDILGIEEVHNEDQITQEIRENTKTLIETLESFNVTASIKGVDRGPRVTRYEVVPARGVKVNQVTHLFDDIRLALAAEGVRMEAPIPGKAAIGFEIPNKKPVNVRLRELIECEEFKNAKSTSFVCLGKDVGGNPIFGDVAKFPHALVAGATGMGKSVCINSILISILYKARPDQVRFILIDPKKVEFKVYSGIPHLLIPVVTEAKQAAGALMWAVEEMERRYDLIEQHNVRNIGAYNEKVANDPSLGQPMPKIVIVIDELNDLMMQVKDPVEDLIMRIAQKARAAGIHLIIGTQRPDVKVITGTIKANINTRISCKVGQMVDSRTVLDMAGAEKLLDKGDMLFKPPDRTQPVRVQGCFVSDSEVEQIMEFLKTQTDGSLYDEEVLAEINKAAQKCGNQKKGGASADDVDDDDEECGYYGEQQFLDAVELAIRSHKVSTALLQRKLRIGFGKAARYIDAMEEIGIVSEPNGQKPRDVLITMDEWHEKLSRVDIN